MPDVPYFATDNEAIGRFAAEDFIRRGLRRLAFCGIPQTRIIGWSEMRHRVFKQIVRETGFAYVQYMTTLFHRYTGQTPGEYRKRARL